MGLLSNENFESWQDLFVQQLEDVYDAEVRLTKALPKMRDAAHDPQLAAAFAEHLQETQQHVERLKDAFHKLGHEPERETCAAMKGLIQEGEEMISAKGDETICDAALIAAAQRVEHYEMAAYGTLRTLAEKLGYQDVAHHLNVTLDEEKAADKKLTQIALERVNPPMKKAG